MRELLHPRISRFVSPQTFLVWQSHFMAPALNLGVEDLLELGLRGQGLAEPHDVLGETVGAGGPGVTSLRP